MNARKMSTYNAGINRTYGKSCKSRVFKPLLFPPLMVWCDVVFDVAAFHEGVACGDVQGLAVLCKEPGNFGVYAHEDAGVGALGEMLGQPFHVVAFVTVKILENEIVGIECVGEQIDDLPCSV